MRPGVSPVSAGGNPGLRRVLRYLFVPMRPIIYEKLRNFPLVSRAHIPNPTSPQALRALSYRCPADFSTAKMPVYAITGANRGFGLEFVQQLTAEAASDVVVLATVRPSADTTDLDAAKASSSGGAVHVLRCDVADADSVRAFAAEAAGLLGGEKDRRSDQQRGR